MSLLPSCGAGGIADAAGDAAGSPAASCASAGVAASTTPVAAVPARNARRDARPVASVAIAHVAAALWRDALLSVVMDASAAHFGQTLMMLVRLIFCRRSGRFKWAGSAKRGKLAAFDGFGQGALQS